MLHLGLISTGRMGQNHLKASLESGDRARVVAVADTNERAAARVARQYGVDFSTDYRDLLRRDDLDAVLVVTPTPTHYPIAREALRAGKHVLVEKPFTETLEQAEELKRLAEDRGRTLTVGLQEAHNSAFGYLLSRREELGSLLHISAERFSPDPVRIQDSIVLDLTHDLDLVPRLTGRAPQALMAVGGRADPRHAAEDYALIMLDFGGVGGVVSLNWFSPERVRRLRVVGTHGLALADLLEQTVTFVKAGAPRSGWCPEMVQETVRLHGSALAAELLDFVEAIEQQRPPLVTAEDGIAALSLALAALGAMRHKEMDQFIYSVRTGSRPRAHAETLYATP
jgi:predicted dehydrogenase